MEVPGAGKSSVVLKQQVEYRDRQLNNTFSKDAHINDLRQARSYRGDKLIWVAQPHTLQDPSKGLHIVTRKTLGGGRQAGRAVAAP